MKIKVLAILAVALSVGLAAGCGRSWHRATPEKKAEWMVKKITRELDLTESQQVTLNRIKDEILAKRLEFKGIQTEISNEFLTQVQGTKVDEGRLNQLLEQKEAKLPELRAFLISKFSEFHATLTPEQRVKLAEKIKKHMKKS